MRASLCGIEFVLCDALIDQGHYIGDDPIGYKCVKPATEVVEGRDLCRGCKSLLEEQPERVTFYPENPKEEGKLRSWSPRTKV